MRPIKKSCDYFSHDKDMRNHRKVKALRCKFKNEGYAVYCMILEYLTGTEENELEYNEQELELLAGDFAVDSKYLEELVQYCIRPLGLFKVSTLGDNKKLYSEGLKLRLSAVYRKRDKVRTYRNQPTEKEVKPEAQTVKAKPVTDFATYILPGIPIESWEQMNDKDQKRYANELWKTFFEQDSWIDQTCRLKKYQGDSFVKELEQFLTDRIVEGTIRSGMRELKTWFVRKLKKDSHA